MIFNTRILIGLCILLLLQSISNGISSAYYFTPLSIEPIQVGGGPLFEWENKLSPNSTATIQLYYGGGLISDWFEPERSTDFTLAGIGGSRRWYLGGEAYSGGYVGLGTNLKAFRVQTFQSGGLTGQGDGLFMLLSFEAGYAWHVFGPLTSKIFMLEEQAFGLTLNGSAGNYTGDQIAFGLKIGAAFN